MQETAFLGLVLELELLLCLRLNWHCGWNPLSLRIFTLLTSSSIYSEGSSHKEATEKTPLIHCSNGVPVPGPSVWTLAQLNTWTHWTFDKDVACLGTYTSTSCELSHCLGTIFITKTIERWWRTSQLLTSCLFKYQLHCTTLSQRGRDNHGIIYIAQSLLDGRKKTLGIHIR
jgi:hypothetical protein